MGEGLLCMEDMMLNWGDQEEELDRVKNLVVGDEQVGQQLQVQLQVKMCCRCVARPAPPLAWRRW